MARARGKELEENGFGVCPEKKGEAVTDFKVVSSSRSLPDCYLSLVASEFHSFRINLNGY